MNNDCEKPWKPLQRSLAEMLLILVAMTPCTPLMADEVESDAANDAAKANTVSLSPDEIPWMSGGIGDDALQEMRKAAAAYNVHVLFTDRQGSYMANIPFTVAGRDGRQILSGVSDGPLLYLRLPPGSYRLSVEIDNAWQNRSIRVLRQGRPLGLSFIGRGE